MKKATWAMPAVLTVAMKSTSDAELSGNLTVTHAPVFVGVMVGIAHAVSPGVHAGGGVTHTEKRPRHRRRARYPPCVRGVRHP